MKKFLKIAIWIAFAIYLALLGYIPLIELLQTYNTVLLLWCLLTVFLLAFLAFILLRFNKLRFLIFAILFVVLHLSIFYVPPVKTAFDIDSCLDSGGAWQDNTCQKPD